MTTTPTNKPSIFDSQTILPNNSTVSVKETKTNNKPSTPKKTSTPKVNPIPHHDPKPEPDVSNVLHLDIQPEVPVPVADPVPVITPEATTANPILKMLMDQGISLDEAKKAIREASKGKPKSKRKYAEIDFDPLFEKFEGTANNQEAWQRAIDHVTMGIKVRKAQFTLEDGGEHIDAAYDTDSGRHGTYHFVAVDRHNNGVWKALTPISEMYAALPPADIYRSLMEYMEALEGVDYRLVECYNSYTGGRQDLRLEISGMEGIKLHSKVTMEILLQGSLDRSKNHVLIARPRMEDGTPIYFVDSTKNQFGLATRHVTSASEKAVEFNAAVTTMISYWNETIVPYIQFLNDGDFSEKEVYALLTGIMEDAKLPKTTQEKINIVRPNQAGTDPMKGIAAICAEIDSDPSPISRDKKSDEVGKAIAKRVAKLFDKKSR